MSRSLGALFLMLVGAGILAVAYVSYRDRDLPAGTMFFGVYRFNRNQNPVALYCSVLLYFCSGITLEVWGLLVMVGMAPPLALR